MRTLRAPINKNFQHCPLARRDSPASLAQKIWFGSDGKIQILAVGFWTEIFDTEFGPKKSAGNLVLGQH